MKILTVDIEEWFHLLDFDATRTEKEWKNYEVRIYDNVERLFRVLEDTHTKATFFVVGWIAKTYPYLVRKIAENYQIGCHTMNHQLVWQQTPQEFRTDVEEGVKILEDVTGKRVDCFRAPGFSIRKSETWAFETLSDLGIKYDCSMFSAAHAHGGMPFYPVSAPGIIDCFGIQMKEFPVSFKNLAGIHVAFSGGGYFRLLPYPLINKWTQKSGDYLLGYIHPRDLDAGQPMIKGLPLNRKFKSYVGLKGAEQKLRRWLTDFQFVDITSAADSIDWSMVPHINLK